MKKKVLLIHPKNESNDVVYPLGCLYLSAFLLRGGFEPILFDHNDRKDYRGFIQEHLSDLVCVGISAITGSQVKYGLEIATYIRKRDNKMPIVWGGRHATSLPEITLQDSRVDIVVRGEGEETFLELVNAFHNRSNLNLIKGISYKVNGQIYHNRDREPLDLSTMPPIPWQLIDIEKKLVDSTIRSISIQTGRDCPFSCTYCSHKKTTIEKYRGFSPDYILNSIEPLIQKHAITYVNFYEPHFISHPKRVEEICKTIVNRRLKIHWSASARANTFVKFEHKLLELLKKSGCDRIGFGFESGSKKILKKIDKRIKPVQVIESVELCKTYHIIPECCFMVGFPFETILDTIKTLAIISKIKRIFSAIIVHMQGYTPFPNTILYDACKRYKLIEPTNLEWWGEYSNIKKNTTWLSPISKIFIKLLSATIFVSDYSYLKKRKDIRLLIVPYVIVNLFFTSIYCFSSVFLKKELE
ncbi:B12-binding domain-containing radical SAM protein [Chlamydiota bacterium]